MISICPRKSVKRKSRRKKILPCKYARNNVFLAKVTGGSGDTYTVDIYGNGSKEPPTKIDVIATVPQIHPREVLPEGYWIPALFKFKSTKTAAAVYEFQPCIWIS